MKTLLSLLILSVLFIGCNDTETKAPKVTETNIETEKVIEVKVNPWTKQYFTDKFGDLTNDGYLYQKTTGSFSNSATQNSFLGIEILVSKSEIAFFFHEYRWTSPSSTDFGVLHIKTENGKRFRLNSFHERNINGGVTTKLGGITGNSSPKFDNYIKTLDVFKKQTGKLKCVYETNYSTVFTFEIDVDGFTKAYSQL